MNRNNKPADSEDMGSIGGSDTRQRRCRRAVNAGSGSAASPKARSPVPTLLTASFKFVYLGTEFRHIFQVEVCTLYDHRAQK